MDRVCTACGSAVPPGASVCGRCGEATPKPEPEWVKKLGPFGAVAVAALKFKTAILLILTKSAQLKMVLSMLASFGLYWTIYGWKFAAGFVIGIYIHEMGHVWMLRQYGLRASAPMFIPGFGAFVSMYDSPANVGQDARIGLAGPLWGAGAAIGFALMQSVWPSGIWMALARVTAFINVFNLTPVWTLDGGRAFRALDYRQRLLWMGAAALLWYATGQMIFALLLAGGAYRVWWKKDHAPVPDNGVLAEFCGLLAIFAALLVLAK